MFVWSQTRNINIICQKGILRYSIPLLAEHPKPLAQMVLTIPEKLFASAQPDIHIEWASDKFIVNGIMNNDMEQQPPKNPRQGWI